MGYEHKVQFNTQKKTRQTVREFNTPLLLLRAAQMGIAIADMALLTVGDITDMCVEQGNDKEMYQIKAEQADFDRF